jgi:hypothetical protein
VAMRPACFRPCSETGRFSPSATSTMRSTPSGATRLMLSTRS